MRRNQHPDVGHEVRRKPYLVTLAGPAGRLEQITTLTLAQRELFAATGVAPPPRVTSLQPA